MFDDFMLFSMEERIKNTRRTDLSDEDLDSFFELTKKENEVEEVPVFLSEKKEEARYTTYQYKCRICGKELSAINGSAPYGHSLVGSPPDVVKERHIEGHIMKLGMENLIKHK